MEKVLGQAGIDQDLQILPGLGQNVLRGGIVLEMLLEMLLLLEWRHDSGVQLVKLLVVLALIHGPNSHGGLTKTNESERRAETKQSTAER